MFYDNGVRYKMTNKELGTLVKSYIKVSSYATPLNNHPDDTVWVFNNAYITVEASLGKFSYETNITGVYNGKTFRDSAVYPSLEEKAIRGLLEKVADFEI